MIVPSMNAKELLLEIAKDYEFVMRKSYHLMRGCRREAVKSKNKHVQRIFDYKSKLKNDWLIIVDYYVADPSFVVVVYYHDNFGFNGIMVGSDNQTLTHYTHHFLERYNERFLKQENISRKELLKRFLSQNAVGFLTYMPNAIDVKNGFFSRIREGIGLGYVEKIDGIQNQLQHFKTFISNDMIFKGQEEVFDLSGKEYEKYWNETYKYTHKGAF